MLYEKLLVVVNTYGEIKLNRKIIHIIFQNNDGIICALSRYFFSSQVDEKEYQLI